MSQIRKRKIVCLNCSTVMDEPKGQYYNYCWECRCRNIREQLVLKSMTDSKYSGKLNDKQQSK